MKLKNCVQDFLSLSKSQGLVRVKTFVPTDITAYSNKPCVMFEFYLEIRVGRDPFQ